MSKALTAEKFFMEARIRFRLWQEVVAAYKEAVMSEDFEDLDDANDQSPIRLYLQDLLQQLKVDEDGDLYGLHVPLSTEELISRLPFRDADDSEINWDGFHMWVNHEGWTVFRNICVNQEPEWFVTFLERYDTEGREG